MRLAVRFSPPEKKMSGSQNAISQHLIAELYRLHPDMVLFTSSSGVFSHVSGMEICRIRKLGVARTVLGAIKEKVLNQLTFELELRKYKCDIVYYPYTHEAVFLTFTVPQIITVHDAIPLIFPEVFPLMSKQWKLFTIPTLKFSNKIITPSENTKKDLVNLAGIRKEKIDVVYNGFRFKSYGNAVGVPKVHEKYLLYVASSQYPHKNLFRLFEAFAKVTDIIPHKLVVVGAKYIRDYGNTDKIINRLGLQEQVLFFENLSNDELSNIYHYADLFVYPSLYEGFGIPPLEAMNHGIPVVAAYAASIPEVCGDAVYYFDPNSVDGIADAIKAGLFNHQLRQQLIIRGIERCRIFSWNKSAIEILGICKFVVNK